MFNDREKDKTITKLQQENQQLKDEIAKLQGIINTPDTANVAVVKLLPNGKVEFDGVEMDNTTPVEYYNSAQATYSELTMFRLGKEYAERQIKKIVESNGALCDELNKKIAQLQASYDKALSDITAKEREIAKLKGDIAHGNKTIELLQQKIKETVAEWQEKLDEETAKFFQYKSALEATIKIWQSVCLNSIDDSSTDTIITKYGKIYA